MLSGKTALVTGSTSGIGLGIARALAHEGASIIVSGMGDLKEIDRICDEMKSDSGCEVYYSPADMMNPKQIRKMVVEAQKKFGSLDILVNNVGIQHVCPIEDYPEEKWDAIIAINLSAAFHATKAAFPEMKKNKWGRIVNIASAHGLVASPFKSAYVAAKHGLVGLTKVTALEGGAHGITCNAICPGYTWTPLVENQIKDTAKSRGVPVETVIQDVMLSEHAVKEFVTIDQLSELTLFLCGDHARSITGAALSVDGGWTAH